MRRSLPVSTPLTSLSTIRVFPLTGWESVDAPAARPRLAAARIVSVPRAGLCSVRSGPGAFLTRRRLLSSPTSPFSAAETRLDERRRRRVRKVKGHVLVPLFQYLSSSICQINKSTLSAATLRSPFLVSLLLLLSPCDRFRPFFFPVFFLLNQAQSQLLLVRGAFG